MPDDFNTLLQILCRLADIHICIHDVAGLFEKADVRLDERFRLHARPFCDAAKSTKAGFACCTGHRIRVNRHGAELREPFEGHCPFGLYEIVHPVIVEGRLVCIVFVGHLSVDREKSRRLLRRACSHTGSPADVMEKLLPVECSGETLGACRETAAFLAERIASISRAVGAFSAEDSMHWAVTAAVREIWAHYDQELTLKDLSKLYFLHEKYLGRLFRKQTGQSFHQYLLETRLSKAEEMLKTTRKTATDVAFACGFNSAAYFNRSFTAAYGAPPSQYRKQMERGKKQGVDAGTDLY